MIRSYRPVEFSCNLYFRSPIKANGHITFDVCAPTGRIMRQVLAKSSVKAIPSLFVALRKTTW
jgi:ribosomal protein RSM22 (predicted rRNA methylase)